MEEEKDNKRRKILSESLLLFLIPVYGYILLYAFESGYFTRLNIPFEFIEISFSKLAYICGFIFIGFIFLVGAIDIIYTFKIHKTAIGRKTLFYFYLLFVAAILPMIAFDYLKRWFPLIIGSTALYLIAEFIFPIFGNKNTKGYKNKLEKEVIKEAKSNEGDFLDSVIRRIGYRAYLAIFILLSITYIAYLSGAISAKTQVNFLVVKSNPELVIIRKYSQNYICAEFDREKKGLINKIYIRTTDQLSSTGIHLSSEKIGPFNAIKK
jgi:hypothetical protein